MSKPHNQGPKVGTPSLVSTGWKKNPWMISNADQMTSQSNQFRLNRKLSLAVLGTIAHTAAIKPSIVSSALVSMPAEFIG